MIPNRNQESISEGTMVSGMRYLCGGNGPSIEKKKREGASRPSSRKENEVSEGKMSE